ncbi:conserved hypothetical protein [Parafrankia sp. EAN1pec]|nr:conserved hypothetical protein [Frankia sp. EAN1pec]
MPDVHDRVVALARRQDDMITRSQARGLGLSDGAIAARRRAHGWHTPIRGTLVIPPVRDRVRAHARAALAAAGGTVCLLTAARLHGLPGLPPQGTTEPVDVAFPGGAAFRGRRGCRRHCMELTPGETTDIAGIKATTVHRTLQDIILRLDRAISVPMLDALLHRGWPNGHGACGAAMGGAVRPSSDFMALKEAVLRRNDAGEGPPGITRLWNLVDGRAGTVLESRVRLALVEAGLEPEAVRWAPAGPATGRAGERVHLAWPSAGLAVQTYELAAPPARERQTAHRSRLQAQLADLGMSTLWLTWSDLHDPDHLVSRIRHRLASSGR